MVKRRRGPQLGTCKLCQRSRPLQLSHLIPRAVYALCRAPKGQNPNPVLVTDDFVMQTSRQHRHHLLCFECEQMLARKGEDWTIPRLASYGGSFPLGADLAKLTPHICEPDLMAYLLNRNNEVDVDAIIHFAMGIFWKASIHSWSSSRKKSMVDLGNYGECIRNFLLGNAPLANDVALATFILPSPVMLITFHFPFETVGKKDRAFQLYVPGVLFLLSLGPNMSAETKRASITSNPARPIVVTDYSAMIKKRFREAYSSANKPAAFLESLPKP